MYFCKKYNMKTIETDKEIKGFFDKYRFLSNFYVSDVFYDGLMYPSSENAYQSAKTLDMDLRNMFIDISPSQSKKLGRKIKVRDDWEDVKFNIMFEIVTDKFNRSESLCEMLLSTGDKYLEETNYWGDKIWGVCNGVGDNWLGKILMDVRSNLR